VYQATKGEVGQADLQRPLTKICDLFRAQEKDMDADDEQDDEGGTA
jgi:hypothetical protein